MKKIISLLLSIILIMIASVTTMADDSNLLNSSSSGYDSYVQNIVHSYLDVAIDIDENDVIYLSQGFPINNSTSSIRIYFLFKNDMCIGAIYVDHTGERYASTFYEYNISEVTSALNENESFAIIGFEESLLFVSPEQEKTIYGPEANFTIANRSNSSNYSFESLVLSPIEHTVYQENSSRVSDELYLDVLHRSNYTLADGTGICWASCAASLGEYYTGTTLTAYQLFIYLQDLYSGTPVGNRTWMLRSAQYYGLTGNYVYSGYAFTNVRNLLRNNKPIYAAIRRTVNLNTYEHAVIIDGYANVSGTTNYCYRMMDPNVNGHAWSEPLSQTATASDFEYIYYNATTGTIRDYTSWYNSMTIN